ncbi:hypothetical protein BGZ75_006879, partial [Mortierella antarctica]
MRYAALQDNPEWRTAFTALSSITSTVLLASVASKCEQSGYSFKTSEGIRSALKCYFEVEFGCQGDTWHCDNNNTWHCDNNNTCTGNP